MELYEGSSFKKDTLVLMTQTGGGMDKLKNTEILTAFKSVMLSRNRIVTAVDIKNFCAAYLQDMAADIRVENGVGVSPMPDQGLMPVVHVKIRPNQSQAGAEVQWERVKTELAAELEHGSAVGVNYLVSIV